MTGAILSPTSENWGTPQWVIQLAENLFHCKFDLDICASDNWTMVPENYITKEQNALDPNTEWNFTNAWSNPPYGKFIPLLLNRVIKEVQGQEFKRVVLLLPAKTEVKWFHNTVQRYAGDCFFLESRIQFNVPSDVTDKGNNTTGTFGSMLVSFDTFSVKYPPCDLHFLSKEKIKDLIKEV